MKALRELLLLMGLTAIPAHASSGETWIPEVRLNLEDGSYKESRIWISGFAYAVYAAGRIGSRRTRALCSPSKGYIDSKVLLDILNQKYEGRRITSEQATKTPIEEIHTRFPCS